MATDNPYTMPSQPLPGPPATSNTVKILVILLAVLFVLGVMCTGVLAALLLPAVSAARDAARNVQVSNQMKQIGIAMHNYHSAYGQLPPAVATNSEGTPTRSWRVTVMPFLEEQYRWKQWDQDEAWDSVANSRLHTPPPFVYISPFDSNQTPGAETHVFAVRHPDGLMSGDPQVNFAGATDGLANTILAVYLPGRTTHWAAPEDITLEQLQAELASASQQNSVIIVFGDGAIRQITSPIDPATVEAMVTRSGGETIAL